MSCAYPSHPSHSTAEKKSRFKVILMKDCKERPGMCIMKVNGFNLDFFVTLTLTQESYSYYDLKICLMLSVYDCLKYPHSMSSK